jgi:endonuclease/exonuclease/phosphatase family metal-dependent hydrolase
MAKTITVMTYNVHSCVGADGKADPIRIAHVIAAGRADIVTLQELDRGLARTGHSDQATEIADHLTMHYHFHPSLRLEEGDYGNAIMSRFPMEVKKTGELPTIPSRKAVERRGALWAEISMGGEKLQVITTHLGLNRRERAQQAQMLLSAEWLRDPACRPPIVLCGDFNATSLSIVYKSLSLSLRDTFIRSRRRRILTYPGRFPLLRLDYIFVSPEIIVKEAHVLTDRLSRTASDHLPVVTTLEIP